MSFSDCLTALAQFYADSLLLIAFIYLFISYAFFVVLYFLSEMVFKGRTIGKFVTGTKAVNMDGSEMEPKTILLRSLCRIVPFEPLSALGNPSRPWHDKWSKSYVVDVKKNFTEHSA